MGRRIRWLGIALLACFALLLVQLTNVQFGQAEKLANSGDNPIVINAARDQSRGDIIAADGTVLATSVLAPKGSAYKYRRTYPHGSLYSQVVGFDSIKYTRSGVEASYNKYLLAHKQQPQSLSELLTPTTSTDTVELTIQPKLQALAQQELAGRDGAVVVLDPSTGAVEAMYGNPTYDPNPLASPSLATETRAWHQYTNPKLADADGFLPLSDLPYAQRFAPGSTFKVVTASAAYDKEPSLATKQFPFVSSIRLPRPSNQTLTNDDGTCGGDIAAMLPPSCDPGFALLGMALGAQNMYDQATAYGFNQIPPIDIPGVVKSVFPTPGTFSSEQQGLAGLAYASIGQGDVQATALQNALDAAAIANHGVIMAPHVVSQVRDANGNVVTSNQPTPWLQATSSATAQALTPIMQAVVTSGTANQVGFLPQDQVAAKTGTAQAGPNNEYDDDWMIAFAPASNPKVAVAVVLPDQHHSTSGAKCSGPVVNAMIQAALGQTPPTTSPLATCPPPQS